MEMEFGTLLGYSSKAGPEKNETKLKCSDFLVNFISRESPILPIKSRVLFDSLGIDVFS